MCTTLRVPKSQMPKSKRIQYSMFIRCRIELGEPLIPRRRKSGRLFWFDAYQLSIMIFPKSLVDAVVGGYMTPEAYIQELTERGLLGRINYLPGVALTDLLCFRDAALSANYNFRYGGVL